jgi:hypothetical protein
MTGVVSPSELNYIYSRRKIFDCSGCRGPDNALNSCAVRRVEEKTNILIVVGGPSCWETEGNPGELSTKASSLEVLIRFY